MPTTPAIVQAQVHKNQHKVQHNLALNGQVHGTYKTVITIPDVGATQVLTGNGTVSPLGSVHLVNSTLHLTGFIAQGHASGTVTLSNGKGSVTLALQGPTQPGFSGAPSSFTYTIQSGMGAYVNAKGKGTVMLQEMNGQTTPTFTMSFKSA